MRRCCSTVASLPRSHRSHLRYKLVGKINADGS
ncbi:hypothetical protein NC651_004206 [Populus alba x Populus x berolinensis]|nr:hypothetical protein NC651_004206 [Populus alba x Populus x berolinensis]